MLAWPVHARIVRCLHNQTTLSCVEPAQKIGNPIKALLMWTLVLDLEITKTQPNDSVQRCISIILIHYILPAKKFLTVVWHHNFTRLLLLMKRNNSHYLLAVFANKVDVSDSAGIAFLCKSRGTFIKVKYHPHPTLRGYNSTWYMFVWVC